MATRAGLPIAVTWMTGALVSLLGMGFAGRELSGELAPHHIAFFRSAMCLLLLLPFVVRLGRSAIRTDYIGRHIARNTVHFAAQWCWLFGLAVLPMAEVLAIEFTSPIWTALLASVFLGERLTGPRVLAIGLGFAGILVLLRPGAAIIDPASFVVLTAAFGYAVSYVITKHLVGRDSAFTVVLWMNVVQLPLGALLSAGNLIIPSVALWPWVVSLGVFGLLSHYCLGRALQHADATVIVPFDFLRLPLAAVIAWVVYSEAPNAFLIAAAMLILTGNWINLKRG